LQKQTPTGLHAAVGGPFVEAPPARWGTRETLLVVAIVGVLIAGMMPSVLGYFARAEYVARPVDGSSAPIRQP
jgi:hypothetical protein